MSSELCSGDFGTIVSAVRTIFNIILWIIPCVLIVLCTIDMFKAMTKGDEKETKAAQKKCITRLIYAVIAFIIPFAVSLIFGLVAKILPTNETATGDATVKDFMSCWSNGTTSSSSSDTTGYCECYGNVTVTTKSACDTTNNCKFTAR